MADSDGASSSGTRLRSASAAADYMTVEVRRCQGITERGAVCPLTNASDDAAAEPLRLGLEDYCATHLEQRFVGFDGADDYDEYRDEEPRCYRRAPFLRFNDDDECEEFEEEEEEENSDDDFDVHDLPSEDDFRGPKLPCFVAGEYGLAGAVWPARPTVPQEFSLPAWAVRPWRKVPAPRDVFRTFAAFIVHAESKAVVGYIEGQLVRRVPRFVYLADRHSSEVYWLLETLFGADDALRPRLKRDSIWGDALDAGRILAIEHLELDPSHRGKGVLRHLSAPLRALCFEWKAACAIAEVVFADEGRVLTTAPMADDLNKRRRQRVSEKLRDSFVSMGFRRVGITDYMAMVLDASHPCWLASSNKPPEFPFREVAKTVRDAEFRRVVERCVIAECVAANKDAARATKYLGCTIQGWDEAKALAEANAAVDALINHDPKALFGQCHKEEYGMPAKFLHDVLDKQMPLWKRKATADDLCRGIEELLGAMHAMGNPIDLLDDD
eukprot:CAMPEP_0174835834 /NCGR_PEP_ID=MMETSP1114-20130205/5635_1 /TAXON_ID=312471 /ORGANISM="Neobodo designis, Strain CCAP 1951/1" /LENGTH=497 /DNA_ID=CAMNT_0016069789 /DNA_START=60 /DNA_END=1553 /DNA_ORIENTATION=-